MSPTKLCTWEDWDADVAFGTFSRLTRCASQPDQPDGGRPWGYLKVEEGSYVDGVFKPERVLNGDQTGWGLVLSQPTVLRVSPYVR